MKWTSKRKSTLVMNILKGETRIQEAARRHGLTIAGLKDWKERFLVGDENALHSRPRNGEAMKAEEI
ncbi:MAG TPA: transposase [Spirochaetia bacterium]|nr:transposase [Spirochaetia bacterium]